MMIVRSTNRHASSYRLFRPPWGLTTLLLFLTAGPIARTAFADSCSDLANLKLLNTKITSAITVSAGPMSSSPGVPPDLFKGMPSFCRVSAEIHPTNDSDIKMEVWMPTSGWNGMFMGRGNGGFAGGIHYAELRYGVLNGYAAASTDTGHTGDPSDALWAIHHPEKVVDFGYRAVHQMTLKSKAIVNAFYAKPPKYSYFDSCSNGGRQALMEAQRFPEDYNGIIAGAPAINWTHMAAGFLWNMKALYDNPASEIPPSKLPLIHSAALRACDAEDGVVDGVIGDPSSCHFDPGVLACKGADSEACLTLPQIDALKKVYSGMVDSQGSTLYPGFFPGGELGSMGWAIWLDAPAIAGNYQHGLGVHTYQEMVYESLRWDFHTFQLDRDVKDADDKLGGSLNATDSNLQPFAQRGGKLILYQGWSDAAIAPLNIVNYYKSVVTGMPTTADSFVRLYMVPGMQHCWGGDGPVEFEMLGSMKEWVEKGVPPASILARQHKDPADPASEVLSTRPLCPYPNQARYKGAGSTQDAANFECK